MDNSERSELFRQLKAAAPKFGKYLQEELDATITSLISLTDIDQVRRAQGKAKFLTQLIEQLEK